MAKYTTAKNIEGHEEVVSQFKQNIPQNRDSWNPPEGYELEFDQYRHSRKGYNHGDFAIRVGAREKRGDVQWRAIAKSNSRWHGTGRNYVSYSTILWAREK